MQKGNFEGLKVGLGRGLNIGLQSGSVKGSFGSVKRAVYNQLLQRNSDQNDLLDPDYLFVIAIASSKGYSVPSASCQIAGSNFIKRLKREQMWDNFDVIYVFAGDGDSDFATLNWKHPEAYQATKVGAITYTSNQGFTGNGSSTYLNTNYTPLSHFVNASQNNNAWAIGINTNPAGGSTQDFGARRTAGTLTTISLYSRLATDLTAARNNCAITDVVSAANTNSIGDYVGFRVSSSAMSLAKDGSTIGTDSSATSVAFPNVPFFICCSNVAGTPTEYSTRQITHWAWGNFGDKVAEWDAAWKEYFATMGVAQTQPVTTVYNNFHWNRYAQPVINGSKTAGEADVCQCTFECLVETPSHWFAFYLASNPLILSDVDRVCAATKIKDDNIYEGWNKIGGNQTPNVLFDVSGVGGSFDEKQVWFRTIIREGGVWKCWYIGQSVTDVFKVGVATSSDLSTWTRYAGNPVYEDSSLSSGVGVTMLRILYDASIKKYRMIYMSNELGENICMAVSPDGITWTKTHSHMLDGRGLGWVLEFKMIEGKYYIWAAFNMKFFSGISDYVKLFRTSDFVTYEDLGIQFEYRGGGEFGITAPINIQRKPNGQWFALGSGYRNQIGKAANFGEEFTNIWAADLATTQPIPIASRRTEFAYPSYVVRHYPLAPKYCTGDNFQEAVVGDSGSIDAGAVTYEFDRAYDRNLGFLSLSGSQTLSFPNNGSIINVSNFGVKVRVSCNAATLTNTRIIFKIGGDIIMSLVSGNLQVVLSADGVAETKKYITTADIAKPSSMSYIDDHIFVGFTWIGGVLTLYSDFNAVAVTKTNDGALTNVNNSGSNIEFGSNNGNGTIMRSVSILSNITDQQWIDLEI